MNKLFYFTFLFSIIAALGTGMLIQKSISKSTDTCNCTDVEPIQQELNECYRMLLNCANRQCPPCECDCIEDIARSVKDLKILRTLLNQSQ